MTSSTSSSETSEPTNVGLATVERVLAVEKHPNADKLDIIKVLGYECIVGREQYNVGDIVVFVQPDSILPADKEWAQEYLRYTSRGRIRAMRLRGSWSMGLVMPLTDVDPASAMYSDYEQYKEGDDMTELLGITKHEPKQPNNKEARGGLPFNIPKTDETRWQSLRHLDKLFGEEVDVTLKMDGQSCTVYCILPKDSLTGAEEPVVGLTSRSLDLKVGLDEEGNPYNSNWHRAASKYDLYDKVARMSHEAGVSLALRGEVTGPGIQAHPNNPAAKDDLTFWLYSVYNISEGRYERTQDPYYFRAVAEELELLAVPAVDSGQLTQEMIDHYDSGIKTVSGLPFEGVVINGDGFSFKVVNKWYDQEK